MSLRKEVKELEFQKKNLVLSFHEVEDRKKELGVEQKIVSSRNTRLSRDKRVLLGKLHAARKESSKLGKELEFMHERALVAEAHLASRPTEADAIHKYKKSADFENSVKEKVDAALKEFKESGEFDTAVNNAAKGLAEMQVAAMVAVLEADYKSKEFKMKQKVKAAKRAKREAKRSKRKYKAEMKKLAGRNVATGGGAEGLEVVEQVAVDKEVAVADEEVEIADSDKGEEVADSAGEEVADSAEEEVADSSEEETGFEDEEQSPSI